MKKYNWGIIGAGRIAGWFAKDLALLPSASLKAIASRSAERAAAFAREYKVPKHYGNWREIAADPDIDIVYVATHHPFHHVNTMDSLLAGKAVLCEKPIAMNRRELEPLVRVAGEKKVFLMEAIWTRFLPSTLRVLAINSGGELGKLHSIYADLGFRREFDPLHRLFDPAKGGGAVLDIGIYPAFISQLLAGPPEEIKASARFAKTGIDHSCSMILEHQSGITSSLNCTVAAESPSEVNLLYEKGRIRMENNWHTPGPITVYRQGREPERVDFPEEGNGYRYEAAEVMRCLQEGLTESPALPLRFSLDLMGTLDRVREICGIRYAQDKQTDNGIKS